MKRRKEEGEDGWGPRGASGGERSEEKAPTRQRGVSEGAALRKAQGQSKSARCRRRP